MKKETKNIFTIYGINSAFSIIGSKNCIIEKIFLLENGAAHKNKRLDKMIHDRNLRDKVVLADLNEIKKIKDNSRTQGVVIIFKFLRIKESIYDLIPESSNHNGNNCILILDQLEDPQNLGQIIRTCECAGVRRILLTRNKSVKLSDASIQVSQGAFINIDFYVCTNLRDALNTLKNKQFWLVSLENSVDNAQNWDTINLKGNIGIILGSEGKGIRQLTLRESDYIATIPMQGEINSLNVSAACSVILFERLRQILD